MVGMNVVAMTPEGKDMVRRDPGLRDAFPELKQRDIATDAERELYGLPTFTRISVPLCLPIEELADKFATELIELGTAIKALRTDHSIPEIHRLNRIKAEVQAINRNYKRAIDSAKQREWDRKSKMSEGEKRYAEKIERDGFVNNGDN